MRKKHILVMDVDDEFGVLTRITGRIRREGLNIAALSVAQTAVPGVSRMTIRVEMQGISLEQVVERLSRFDCVRTIQVCQAQTHLVRELALISCKADSPLCKKEKTVSRTAGRVCFEKTGTPEELDRYLQDNLGEILEFSRSGAITLQQGGTDDE